MEFDHLTGESAPGVPLSTYESKKCRNKQIGKACKSCEAHSSNPRISVAENISQLRQAFRLVHQRYVELGYMRASECGMRFSAFELLPTTRTFVAVEQNEVISTASLVLDTPIGLPSEYSFEQEIAALREKGRILAEGTMFAADAGRSDVDGKRLSIELMQEVFQWCNSLQIDDLLLVVNPKHLAFWYNLIGFERLSLVKSCTHVKGNDGYLLRLDMRAIRDGKLKPSRIVEKLLNVPTRSIERFSKHFTLCEDDVLALLEENPTLLSDVTRGQCWLLAEYFPVAMSCIRALDFTQQYEIEAFYQNVA